MPWRAAVVVMSLLMVGSGLRAEYFITDIVSAAQRGDAHAVHRLIVDSPESVEAIDAAGYTALHWAGIRGQWRMFQELVAAGAPVNAKGGDGGTPLHWTAHHDRPEMVRLLLDAGAEIGVHNRWGRTPLHVAARRGCGQVASLLLEAGADPDAATLEGWTPLHVAYMSGHPEMVSLLEAGGADASKKDEEGLTPVERKRLRPEPVPVDPAALEEFQGVYDLGGGFAAKVWLEDGRLRIQEFAPDDLYAIGRDTFFCRQEPWTVRFQRDDSGQVSAVELDFLRRTVRGDLNNLPRYVGSAVCLECHTAMEKGNPGISWLKSRHGHAYWRLGADWALFLARLRPHNHDLENPLEDARCLYCHVTGSQDPEGFTTDSFRQEEGVGCESCHGAGSEYMAPEVMADRASFEAHGGQIPDENTCRGCHRNSENFDYGELWPKIAHGGAAKQ